MSVEAVVVGALGSWDRGNERVIARLCSRKYAKLLRKLVVAETLRSSRDIYIYHLTGIRQLPTSRSDRHATALNELMDNVRAVQNSIPRGSPSSNNNVTPDAPATSSIDRPCVPATTRSQRNLSPRKNLLTEVHTDGETNERPVQFSSRRRTKST